MFSQAVIAGSDGVVSKSPREERDVLRLVGHDLLVSATNPRWVTGSLKIGLGELRESPHAEIHQSANDPLCLEIGSTH